MNFKHLGSVAGLMTVATFTACNVVAPLSTTAQQVRLVEPATWETATAGYNHPSADAACQALTDSIARRMANIAGLLNVEYLDDKPKGPRARCRIRLSNGNEIAPTVTVACPHPYYLRYSGGKNGACISKKLNIVVPANNNIDAKNGDAFIFSNKTNGGYNIKFFEPRKNVIIFINTGYSVRPAENGAVIAIGANTSIRIIGVNFDDLQNSIYKIK
jgi:hypothetical protein